MSIIKQLATYDGSAWTKDDIGANASNVSLSSNIAGSSNVQGALSNLCGASKLNKSSAIVTNSSGVLTASNVTSTELGYLSGVTSNLQEQIDNLIQNEIIGSESYPVISCANLTETLVASQSLYAGLWLVLYGGAFDAPLSGSGYRRVILTHSFIQPEESQSRPTYTGVSGDQTIMVFTQVLQNTQNNTIYLYAQQNSGETLDFYPYIQAICLKKF